MTLDEALEISDSGEHRCSQVHDAMNDLAAEVRRQREEIAALKRANQTLRTRIDSITEDRVELLAEVEKATEKERERCLRCLTEDDDITPVTLELIRSGDAP